KTAFTLFIVWCSIYSSSGQPGTLNKKFGDSGKVLTGYNNAQSTSTASAMQTDNKAVVVGNYDSIGVDGYLILRYLPGGQLDNSFGNNGKVVINFGYDIQEARSVVIQSDGKIVVAGYGETGMFDENYDVVAARLTTNGKLDSTFGNNGKVLLDFGTDETGNSVCLQQDGKIIIGGIYNNSDFLTVRLKTNGSLDSTYGNNGKVISTFNQLSSIASVAAQSDGKIVAGGIKGGSISMFVIARYNSNGSNDITFGTGGFVYTDYGANADEISKIIIQPDQKIIAIGGTGLHFDFIHEYVAVARYKTNGNFDSSFGINGKSTLQYANNTAYGNDAVLQTDGKIIISGNLSTDTTVNYLLVRLKTNGSFDSSFGTSGTTITSFGMYDIAYGVRVQGGDSSIIASGTSQSYNYDTTDVSLAAYNQSGVRQMIVAKIKHWLQHHNGIVWNNINGISSYIVQRSYDGIHFSSIARINANNNSALTYNDVLPLSGNNYYRLQTTSVIGAVNYSNVIAVTAVEDAIKISPNPAINILYIESLPSNQKVKITVVDFTGNVQLQAVANNTAYNLNIASLKTGNYILKIETGNSVITKKFIKE
ncbi:MAG: T9SS type A sorting domain-containing protein, partial [Parafilimonas sp.]